MTQVEYPNRKSKLLQWLIALFLGIQVFSLIQSLMYLAAPVDLTVYSMDHPPFAIAMGCIGMFFWAPPILAIILLAMSRGQRYRREAVLIGIAVIGDFAIKMLLGMVWMVVLIPYFMQNVGPRPNPATMTAEAIESNLLVFRFVQAGSLLTTLGASLLTLRWRQDMAGRHFKPPEDQPAEEAPDLGEESGWDEPRAERPHDRNR